MLIGVRKGSAMEFALPPSWRARWTHAGGRIVREEEGEVTEPVSLSDLRQSPEARLVTAPVPAPVVIVEAGSDSSPEPASSPKRKAGRR